MTETELSEVPEANKVCKPGKKGNVEIDFLETFLIGLGVQRNSDLMNIQKSKLLRDLHVPGFINTRRGEGKRLWVQELRKIFGA